MFKHLHRHNSAQSSLEFVIIIILVMAVFLVMNNYVRRGLQGRWKSTIDDFGEQYEPGKTNTTVTYASNTDSWTNITTQLDKSTGGYYSDREDHTQTNEEHTIAIKVNQEN